VYEKPFRLDIITPARVVFQGEATSLGAPGMAGNFQVLYNHAPLLSAIGVGALKVRDTKGQDVQYSTSGGFVEVKDNAVVVLAESVEREDEIVVSRAEAARVRAQQRMDSRSADVDYERARAALMRAVNRLRVAGK
jgi:F-type H+-transporting ATPase subunit epsilon